VVVASLTQGAVWRVCVPYSQSGRHLFKKKRRRRDVASRKVSVLGTEGWCAWCACRRGASAVRGAASASTARGVRCTSSVRHDQVLTLTHTHTNYGVPPCSKKPSLKCCCIFLPTKNFTKTFHQPTRHAYRVLPHAAGVVADARRAGDGRRADARAGGVPRRGPRGLRP
jgi:hypothetical protein